MSSTKPAQDQLFLLQWESNLTTATTYAMCTKQSMNSEIIHQYNSKITHRPSQPQTPSSPSDENAPRKLTLLIANRPLFITRICSRIKYLLHNLLYLILTTMVYSRWDRPKSVFIDFVFLLPRLTQPPISGWQIVVKFT